MRISCSSCLKSTRYVRCHRPDPQMSGVFNDSSQLNSQFPSAITRLVWRFRLLKHSDQRWRQCWIVSRVRRAKKNVRGLGQGFPGLFGHNRRRSFHLETVLFKGESGGRPKADNIDFFLLDVYGHHFHPDLPVTGPDSLFLALAQAEIRGQVGSVELRVLTFHHQKHL